MNKNESGFRAKNLFFSVERVEFEMAVFRERLMASVAYSRTKRHINISS